jgi:hypothetical protein
MDRNTNHEPKEGCRDIDKKVEVSHYRELQYFEKCMLELQNGAIGCLNERKE